MNPARAALYVVGLLLVGGCASPHQSAGATSDHQVAHPGGHAHRGGVEHRFEDPARWAKIFEDPARDAWQKPDEVIQALAIPHGARVADIGAATGYFPIRIAKQRPDVTVFGADIEASMAAFLEDRARREGLSNVTAVKAEADDPRLPARVKRVLLVDTYHHIEERPAYFARLAKQYLEPDARIAIIDFKMESERGPRAEHKIAPQEVISEMKAAGLELIARHDFLPDQYFLVFAPAPG